MTATRARERSVFPCVRVSDWILSNSQYSLFLSLSSPTPTLEEVNAWAQSFDKLMLTPAGRNAFREFLRTEFSEENMLFWMACEDLKKESNKSIIEEKARLIYEDYISILSPKEVCNPFQSFFNTALPGDLLQLNKGK